MMEGALGLDIGPAARGCPRIRRGAAPGAHGPRRARGAALSRGVAERGAAAAGAAADLPGGAGARDARAGRRDRRRRRALALRPCLHPRARGARHPPRARAGRQGARRLRDRGLGTGGGDRGPRRGRGGLQESSSGATWPCLFTAPCWRRAASAPRSPPGTRAPGPAAVDDRLAQWSGRRRRRRDAPAPSSAAYREAGVTLPAIRPIGFPGRAPLPAHARGPAWQNADKYPRRTGGAAARVRALLRLRPTQGARVSKALPNRAATIGPMQPPATELSPCSSRPRMRSTRARATSASARELGFDPRRRPSGRNAEAIVREAGRHRIPN